MMIRPYYKPVILLVFVAGFIGAAKSATPKFIPADTLDITTFLPPPPAAVWSGLSVLALVGCLSLRRRRRQVMA